MRVSLVYALSASALAFGLASAASAQTEGTIEAAGASFPYIEAGEGEPVLLLHGALADHRLWEGMREDIAADHRFIALTMRHFGPGDWPDDKPFARDVHDADLIAVLQAWGEPMHLVGWSYSGPMVLRAAVEVPELVRSVTIYEPTLRTVVGGTPEGDAAVKQWGEGFADTAVAFETGDLQEATREAIEYVFGLEEGGFETLPEQAQDIFLANAHTIPLDFGAPKPTPVTCEQLATAKAPTLLIVGSETYPIFTKAAAAVDKCMPNAEVHTIDGVGLGGPLQKRDEVLSALLDFVGRH